MGEAKRRKIDGKYVFYKGSDYKLEQWRLLMRLQKYIEMKRREK